MLAFAVPILYVSTSLGFMRYVYGRVPKEVFTLTYILSVGVGAVMIYIGSLNGLSTVPGELSLLAKYLMRMSYVGVGIAVATYVATYLAYVAYLRVKGRKQ